MTTITHFGGENFIVLDETKLCGTFKYVIDAILYTAYYIHICWHKNKVFYISNHTPAKGAVTAVSAISVEVRNISLRESTLFIYS